MMIVQNSEIKESEKGWVCRSHGKGVQ